MSHKLFNGLIVEERERVNATQLFMAHVCGARCTLKIKEMISAYMEGVNFDRI